MDANPDETGTHFAMFTTGEAGREYIEGEERAVELYGVNGRVVELRDYHWPAWTYRRVLKAAGFSRVKLRTPRLARAHDFIESRRAPLLIASAEKRLSVPLMV
jgi:hypothetical protein